KLASLAWRRTMENLARIQLNSKSEGFSRESIFSSAQMKFSVTYEFCRGDLSQDIYQDLIHNQNNMRPQELNSLFKISGLSNICMVVSDYEDLKLYFGNEDKFVIHQKITEALEDFFDRRNKIAH